MRLFSSIKKKKASDNVKNVDSISAKDNQAHISLQAEDYKTLLSDSDGSYQNVRDIPLSEIEQDFLNNDVYAEALSNFISSAITPVTIAVQGEWGTGKTSLLNLIKHHLCDDNNCSTAKMKSIWINMWQYSLTDSPESIVSSVIVDIIKQIKSYTGDNLALTEATKGYIYSSVKFVSKVASEIALKKLGIDSEVINNALSDGSYFNREVSNKNDVSMTNLRNTVAKTIRNYLKDNQTKSKDCKGFIFFIDDLDRLDPPMAVSVIEVLKNIFDIENCVFVLAIDYEVVIKGLEPKFGKYSKENERQFRSFFDKVIQLPFSMPTENYNIMNYLTENLLSIKYFSKRELESTISDDNHIITKEVLKDIVESSAGRNPRSIKRIINSLSLISFLHESKLNYNKLNNRADSSDDNELECWEKVVNFILVCLQISYPTINSMLKRYPEFRLWDEKVISDFKFDKLDKEDNSVKSLLESLTEQVKVHDSSNGRLDICNKEAHYSWIYYFIIACSDDLYMKSRIRSILDILLKLEKIVPKEYAFDEVLSKLNDLTGTTSIDSLSVSHILDEKMTEDDCYDDKQAKEFKPYLIFKVKQTVVDSFLSKGAINPRYAATRGDWKRITPERANKCKYVLSVTDGIVKAVYQDCKWRDSESIPGRYVCDGIECTDQRVLDFFLNKRIPAKYRKKGMASPSLYSNDNDE